MLALPILLPASLPASNGIAGDWQQDKIVNGVEFYHSIQSCSGKTVVLLKIINKNKYRVSASWKELFVTKQVSVKKEGVSGRKELALAPGETMAGSCEDSSNRKLRVLPEDVSPAYAATVQQFEYSNLQVTTVL